MVKIVEIGTYSLKELNEYIATYDIKPTDVLAYRTIFDQIKGCTKYILTFWKQVTTKE